MEGLKPRGRPKVKIGSRSKTEVGDESGHLDIKVRIVWKILSILSELTGRNS